MLSMLIMGIAFIFNSCKPKNEVKYDKIRIEKNFTVDNTGAITITTPDFNFWDTDELKNYKDKKDKVEDFEIDSITFAFPSITGNSNATIDGYLYVTFDTGNSFWIYQTCGLDSCNSNKFSDFKDQHSLDYFMKQYTTFSAAMRTLGGFTGSVPNSSRDFFVMCNANNSSMCAATGADQTVHGYYALLAKDVIKSNKVSIHTGENVKNGTGFTGGLLRVYVYYHAGFPTTGL